MRTSYLFKALIITVIFLLSTRNTHAQNEFITYWKPTTNSIKMMTASTFGNYSYNLRWRVKGTSTWVQNLSNQMNMVNINTTDYIGDTLEVQIWGTYPYFRVNNTDNDPNELIEVVQWGTNSWKSTQQMFKDCANLVITATDTPNFSQVYYMHEMFAGCSNFNNNLNNWNVANVTHMNSMFAGCTAYNQPMNNWNVANVIEMSGMFNGCHVFNQNINNWNVGNVTAMNSMFRQARAFNQPLNSWNMSKVETIASMFEQTEAFNQDIQAWNLAVCTNASGLFHSAYAFNAPLEDLDISNITNLSRMFYQAQVFDQPLNGWTFAPTNVNVTEIFAYSKKFNHALGQWNISSFASMNYMFFSSNYSYCKMDTTLIAWQAQNAGPSGVQFFANHSIAANNAKTYFSTVRAWTFITNVEVDIATNPMTVTFPQGLCASNVNNTIQGNNSTTFHWSTGEVAQWIHVPNNTPGTYTISATDQCGNSTGTITYTVGQDNPVMDLGPDIIICDDELTTSITINATGAATYQWPGSFNFLPVASHTMNVNLFQNLTIVVQGRSEFGCPTSDTILISKINEPYHTLNYPSTAVCAGEDVVLSATNADSFVWKIYSSENDLLATLNGSNVNYSTPQITAASANYATTLEMTFSSGCVLTKNFQFTTDNCSLGLDQHSSLQPFIYPNPASNRMVINTAGMFDFEIINQLGQLVLSGQSNGFTEVDLSLIPEGFYIINVMGKEMSTLKFQVIK